MTDRAVGALLLALVLLAGAPQGAAADQTLESLLRRGEGYLLESQRAYTAGDSRRREQLAAKAEETFAAARRLDPRDLRIWFLGCQAAAFRGDRGSAADWYEGYRARTLHVANDPDLQYLQAFIYIFAANTPDKAIAALTRMHSLAPRRRPVERDTLLYIARLLQGNVLMQRDLHLAAVKEFTEAARLARRRGWVRKEMAALGNSGIALTLASEYKRAIEVFDGLIEREPDNILWHWRKGLALGSEHRFAEALPVYRRVIELLEADAVLPQHRADVSQVYMRYGNCVRHIAGQITQDAKRKADLLKEAEARLQTYTRLYPDVARGYRWLGELYFRDMDRPYDAIPMYEKALALDWVCGDVPLRSLVQIYAQNPPPAGPGSEAERREAWTQRRLELQKQRDEGAEKRRIAREEREKNTPEKTDGCS